MAEYESELVAALKRCGTRITKVDKVSEEPIPDKTQVMYVNDILYEFVVKSTPKLVAAAKKFFSAHNGWTTKEGMSIKVFLVPNDKLRQIKLGTLFPTS